jgi:hypothetical protein
MTLRIGPVPDRAPAKLTLSLAPETFALLADYAAIHSAEHGREASAAELAALMIEKFLETDAGFRRARKALGSTKSSNGADT